MAVLNDIPAAVRNAVRPYSDSDIPDFTGSAGTPCSGTTPADRLLWLANLLRTNREYRALHVINDLSHIVQTSVHAMGELIGGTLDTFVNEATAALEQTGEQFHIKRTPVPAMDSIRLTVTGHSLAVDMDYNDNYKIDGRHSDIIALLYTLLRRMPEMCLPHGRVSLTLKDDRDITLLLLAHSSAPIPDDLLGLLFHGGRGKALYDSDERPATLHLAIRRGTVEFSTDHTSDAQVPTILTFAIDINVGNRTPHAALPLRAILRCSLAPEYP